MKRGSVTVLSVTQTASLSLKHFFHFWLKYSRNKSASKVKKYVLGFHLKVDFCGINVLQKKNFLLKNDNI